MKNISYTYQRKVGNKYVDSYVSTDPVEVYERLSSALLWKYVFKGCDYGTVKRVNNNDRTQTIYVGDKNGGRYVFVVAV